MSDSNESNDPNDRATVTPAPSRPTKITYLRRAASLRSRAPSSMPVDDSNLHSLYIEVANLQMARSRQEKIRKALLTQVRRSDEAIAQAIREIELVEQKIAAIERRKTSASSHHKGQPKETTSDGTEPTGQGFVFDY